MVKFSQKKLNQIAKQYNLADVYVFGSKITGFQRKGSDLDIGVRFQKDLPEPSKRGRVYANLFADLNLIFKGQKIDLVFIEEVPLHFKFNILSQGKLIYSQNLDKTFNFKEYIFNYYRDYKYFIDEYFQGILATA